MLCFLCFSELNFELYAHCTHARMLEYALMSLSLAHCFFSVSLVPCFGRTKRVGAMVFCDFCPLAFHLDCLDPPLTNLPNTLWMCPNHAEHHIPSFRHPRLSNRCEAMESASKMLDQRTVVLDFLQAANRYGAVWSEHLLSTPPPILGMIVRAKMHLAWICRHCFMYMYLAYITYCVYSRNEELEV